MKWRILFLTIIIINPIVFIVSKNTNIKYPNDLYISETSIKNPVMRQALYSWTIMIYLDGDNNLESAALDDFLEISSIGSTDNVSLIVLLDRWNGTGSDDDTTYGDWTDARIFHVDQFEQPYAENADVVLGEINMGSYSSILYLVNYSIQNFPAKYYALILWDHGVGFQGLCIDEDNGNDILFLNELRQALKEIYRIYGVKINILGMDACLMGLMEVVYMVRDFVDYIVFSQEYEPENGWPYDRIFGRLINNPDMLPEDLASLIVNEYVAYYSEPIHRDINVTLSAIDVEKFVRDAIPRLNRLVGYMLRNYDVLENEISYVISITEEYGRITPCYAFEKDLIDFLVKLKDVTDDVELISLIDDAREAINSSVLLAEHLSGHPNSHGISAVFDDSCLTYLLYDFYMSIEPSKHQQWDEFLAKTRRKTVGIWFYDIDIDGIDSDLDGYYDTNISLVIDLDSEGSYNLTIKVLGQTNGSEYIVGYEEHKYISGISSEDKIWVRLGIPQKGIYNLRVELYDENGILIKQYYYYCDIDLIGLKLDRTEYQVDTTPPTVIILEPEDGAVFYDQNEISFTISVSDNFGIDKIIIYVNGTEVYQFNETVSSFTLVFSQYGTFSITVKAIDISGNSNSDSVIIHLRKSGELFGKDTDLLIATLVIALLIIIAIILLRRE